MVIAICTVTRKNGTAADLKRSCLQTQQVLLLSSAMNQWFPLSGFRSVIGIDCEATEGLLHLVHEIVDAFNSILEALRCFLKCILVLVLSGFNGLVATPASVIIVCRRVGLWVLSM